RHQLPKCRRRSALHFNSCGRAIHHMRRGGAASPKLANIEDLLLETGRPRPASDGKANKSAKPMAMRPGVGVGFETAFHERGYRNFRMAAAVASACSSTGR